MIAVLRKRRSNTQECLKNDALQSKFLLIICISTSIINSTIHDPSLLLILRRKPRVADQGEIHMFY